MSDDAVIGIDLGTTNTVVASVIGDKIEIIPDQEGRRLHPSVVAFPPTGGLLVGEMAKQRRVIDPGNTIYSAKRIIGQPFGSPGVQEVIKHLPYKVEEGENQEPIIVTRAGRSSVPEIAAHVLGYVRGLAQEYLGRRVSQCVVTVPANFSDAQREATRHAAWHAGLGVLRILNEPTAAALAYGQGRELHSRIAVFDLGGGTFDLTLLAVRDDMFEVVSTGGDAFLGGDDIDRALAWRFSHEFLKLHRLDLTQDWESMGKLLLAAEEVKTQLSKQDVVEHSIPELAHGVGGAPLALNVRVTRAEFDELIDPIVTRALIRSHQVLAEAEVRPGDVDEVVLAGGTTRVPYVRQKIEELFGRKPLAGINPMGVVAAGAALHAENLIAPADAPAAATGLLMDVTSHALGIATTGGFTEHLIDKNTPIPTERSKVFTTARDGQWMVRIRVCQGQDRRFDRNVPVGELRLDHIRPARRGDARIEVAFLVDANGILSVTARDLETGRDAHAVLSLFGVAAAPPPPGPPPGDLPAPVLPVGPPRP
jgi:molecular chaperone DnaK